MQKQKTKLKWSDQNFLLLTYFWKLSEFSFKRIGLKWKIYTTKTRIEISLCRFSSLIIFYLSEDNVMQENKIRKICTEINWPLFTIDNLKLSWWFRNFKNRANFSSTYSVIHISIPPSKELCSKMATGEVDVSLPWWCHTLVLPPPGYWGLFLNLIIFS